MNLIVAESAWWEGPELRPGWAGEWPCLARWNRIFLWREGDAAARGPEDSGLAGMVEIVGRGKLSRESLSAWMGETDLSPDESALVGISQDHAAAAAGASIPCYALAAGEKEGEAFRAAGVEDVFPDVAALAEAVAKTNAVERRFFPIVTVGGLLRDEGGDWLLVRTRKWSNQWGIPGGKVQYGETMETAFLREVREETGLGVRNCRLALVQEAIEHPEFYRPRHFLLINYLAEVLGRRPAVSLNHEGVDYLWTPPAEAMRLALNGPTRLLAEKALEGEALWTS